MSKSILLTGMNKLQCTRNFHLNQQLKVVPSHYSLYNCLHAMGYKVEQREVVIGENLDRYDHIIVFIAAPKQFAAISVFNGLWAIKARPDCILAFDDWQVKDLFDGTIAAGVDDRLLSEFILTNNKKTVDDIKPRLDDYKSAIETIAKMDNKMLISAFSTSHLEGDFGAHLLFKGTTEYPKDKTFVYNPNPFHRNRKIGDYDHIGLEAPDYITNPLTYGSIDFPPSKQRSFNFASLVQSKTRKWLKVHGFIKNMKDDEIGMIKDWAVDMYGSKAGSQKRLTEDMMCKIFARDWGCLMPGYEHAGSGWWRARPLQAADAGAIIIGEPKELAVYYGAEFYANKFKASTLVDMSDNELLELARDQRDALYKLHPLDKNVQIAEIVRVLS